MTGYTKLFGSILASTIWSEPKETKVLWITMLAMAGKHGEVHASIPGLAHTAHLSIEETEMSLQRLMQPDAYSRTKEFEGRRIQEIDGGWQILNHAKYRKLMSAEERKEYLKMKQAESRERKRKSTPVNTRQQKSTMSTQAEADTKADSDAIPATSPKDAVVEAWNSLGKPFPKVLHLSPDRTKELLARLKDKWWVENYREALDFIKTSKFCRGETPPREGKPPWVADFDFFIRPGSVAKALEGKYKNTKEKACSV